MTIFGVIETRSRARPGITRLEVLIAAVLALFVIGLTITMIAHHRENAQRVQCKNNLKLIGEAFRAYHDASSADGARKRLPPIRIAESHATWAVLLAPYLSKEHALKDWDLALPYVAQKSQVREAPSIYFFCPARPRSGVLSEFGDDDRAKTHFPGALGDYAAVAGDGSPDRDWTGPDANGTLVLAEVIERKDERIVKWHSRTSIAMLARGESYTLLAGEKHVPEGHFGDAAFGDGSLYNGAHPASFSRVAGKGFPIAPSIDSPFNRNFGSHHNGVCQFLNADTTVRTMTLDTSEFVLGELSRRGE